VRPLGLFQRITGAAADEHSWIALAEQQRGELPAEVPGPYYEVYADQQAQPPGEVDGGKGSLLIAFLLCLGGRVLLDGAFE
jgi:hypothetical protein